MRTFFLDLAGNPGTLACVDSAVRAIAVADRKISDADLLPLAEKTLRDAGWTWESVERIACVAGPGGFMSLRVAAAFANALAWERKISVASIHLSDLCFARSSLDACVWIHSTKKLELFTRGFGSFSSLWPEPMHLRLEEFLTTIPAHTPLIGELIPEHVQALGEHGCTLQALRPLEEILPAFLQERSYTAALVQPWYGREG
jgi:hypothetical protein